MRRLLAALTVASTLAATTLFAAPVYTAFSSCDPSEIGVGGSFVENNQVRTGSDGVNYRCVNGVWQLA